MTNEKILKWTGVMLVLGVVILGTSFDVLTIIESRVQVPEVASEQSWGEGSLSRTCFVEGQPNPEIVTTCLALFAVDADYWLKAVEAAGGNPSGRRYTFTITQNPGR